MTDKNGKQLQTLPTGVFSFENIKNRGHIYVDKTERLLELINVCDRCFLSRPRRFGKSLTVSTLKAMFSGKAELFEGLAAEEWVKEQAKHPNPVLSLDMSMVDTSNIENFNISLAKKLEWLASDLDLSVSSSLNNSRFEEIIRNAYKNLGPVVVLIDEYDKPMLDYVSDHAKAEEMRTALRSFYTVLKGCEEYLRFVLLTGISKFSKVGIFSAMNNLVDISMDRRFGDIVGYTQQELEDNFSDWLDYTADRMSVTRDELLRRIKAYYDGFCFDCETRLYNPFSTLLFLGEAEFRNYWYTSGSPRCIIQYMKDHGIKNPDEYRHIKVDINFADSREIESARPESFLYQAGYLTIERQIEERLVLDYPNREVRESIYRAYLDEVWQIDNSTVISLDMRDALRAGDVAECVRLFETMIFGIPYDVFARTERNEAFYQLLFLLALRGVNIEARGEVHNAVGRSDVEITLDDCVIVLELKCSKDGSDVEKLTEDGLAQIKERGYTHQHEHSVKKLISGVIVINDKEKKAVYTESAHS